MKKAALLLLCCLLLSGRATANEWGYASAYAPGVMEGVVRVRLDNDWWPVALPVDWYTVHGYIAVMDCSRVGQVTTVYVGGQGYRVLIADCAGDDGPPERFQEMGVILELDARLWEKFTAQHGRPLVVGLDT